MTNPGEMIRLQLKNLSDQRKRPFDEILRYYAMERFLYRVSISPYVEKFFLKGGMLLKIWDPIESRATMDIDFLARMSNSMENLRRVISEIAGLQVKEDGIIFKTEHLSFEETQTGGDYRGVCTHFSARLFTTPIPMRIDIGFSDIIIPAPQDIQYPTLLSMRSFKLKGYTLETVIAEKLQSVVKLAHINTRMKDFYDLWSLCRSPELQLERLKVAIQEVFANRETTPQYPIAFKQKFYSSPKTKKLWQKFIKNLGKEEIALEEVITEIANFLGPLLK